MHIAFFIGSLGTGGAERQMVLLAKGLAARGHHVSLITIFPGGSYSRTLTDVPNLTLLSLNPTRERSLVKRTIQLVGSPVRLRRFLKRERPDRLYSMLHLSNLFAWLATNGALRARLVWGCRASNMQLNWKRLIPDRLCAWVSPTVPLMIANSEAGARFAKENRGFRPGLMAVVPNGIDTDFFCPSPGEGARVRAEFGVAEEELLIGIVGRIDPMKGHDVFLRAARHVYERRKDCRFLVVGHGPQGRVESLTELAERLGVGDRIIWAGNRTDMPALYSAIDVLCSSSYGEGFPNVIGEAMACGTPCVVTDVGDSARIIGQLGRVVAVDDSGALGRELLMLSDWGRGISVEALRARIQECFSVDSLCQKTERLLQELCGGR